MCTMISCAFAVSNSLSATEWMPPNVLNCFIQRKIRSELTWPLCTGVKWKWEPKRARHKVNRHEVDGVIVASVFDIQYRMEVDLNLVLHFQPIPMYAILCVCFPLCVQGARGRARDRESETGLTCIRYATDPVFIFMEKHMWRECHNRNIAAIEKWRKRDKTHALIAHRAATAIAHVWTNHCCCCCSFSSRITLEFSESFRERCCAAFASHAPLHPPSFKQLISVSWVELSWTTTKFKFFCWQS